PRRRGAHRTVAESPQVRALVGDGGGQWEAGRGLSEKNPPGTDLRLEDPGGQVGDTPNRSRFTAQFPEPSATFAVGDHCDPRTTGPATGDISVDTRTGGRSARNRPSASGAHHVGQGLTGGPAGEL